MVESEKEMGGCRYTCQIILSVLIFIMAFVALIFSIAVALSCDFVEVVLGENTPASLTSSNLTSLSVGQYRYNPNGEGCQSLRQNNIDISWDFITGQIGLLVAVVCAIVVIMLLLVEATCCRFPCSRCIITTLLVLAVIGMAMTFLTYASSVCQSTGGPYPCQASNGTWYAVVAVVFYIFTVFFYCLSPKPKPLCKKVREKKKSEHDPCLCCEKKEDKETEEERDEEKAEKEPPHEAGAAVAAGTGALAEEPPHEVVAAVAAGTGAAAMANVAHEERPPSQVVYYKPQVVYNKNDMSDDESSIGVMTVPFHRSADVLEGDLFFDANTVA